MPQITIEKIGAQIGHPELVIVAKKILVKYKERFINSLPEIQRQNVKFNSAPFVSVPMVLAAEYRNVKIDRQVILDLTETRWKDFKKIYDSMDELVMQPIKLELEKINQNDPKKKSKRKRSIPLSDVPVIYNSTDNNLEPVSKQLPCSESDNVSPKIIKESELNNNVLVNKEKISEHQVEKDIEELAYNENSTVTLPKPILDLKKKQEFQLWKETVLSVPKVPVSSATEQTCIDDYFLQSPQKKRRVSKGKVN